MSERREGVLYKFVIVLASALTLSACAKPVAVPVDVAESTLIPKPPALDYLRSLPRRNQQVPCYYRESGISSAGRAVIPYERWTVAYEANVLMSSVYVSITEGRRGPRGANLCAVYVNDPRVAGHDQVVAKTMSALVSLGAKPYKPGAAQ